MKRLVYVLILASSVVLAPSTAQAGANPAELKLLAMTFVDRLSKADFAGAAKGFDAGMQQAMPVDKLEETWNSLGERVGPFQKQTGARCEPGEKYDVVYVTCAFEKLA